MVSRRRAAGNPRYSTARRSLFTPAVGTHARSVIVRKTMQLFRANVDSGGLSIRIRCRGTRSGGSTQLYRLHTRLSSLHFAPLLIHSRSIILKAETPRVYLRDALIYPALVSLSPPSPPPAFVSHFHLSPGHRSVWRAGVVAALIISVISTASTQGTGEVGAAGRRGGPPTIAE